MALPYLFYFFAEYFSLYLSRLFRQYSLHFMATLNNKPVILNPRREVIVTHLHNHTCKKCSVQYLKKGRRELSHFQKLDRYKDY